MHHLDIFLSGLRGLRERTMQALHLNAAANAALRDTEQALASYYAAQFYAYGTLPDHMQITLWDGRRWRRVGAHPTSGNHTIFRQTQSTPKEEIPPQ